MMRRVGRVVVALAVLSAATAFAQQPAQLRRVAVIAFGSAQSDSNVTAIVEGLRELGYVESRLAIDVRYADGRPERVRDLAVDAAASRPDVIVALGGDVVPYVQQATRTIPIVMLTSNDPVQAGTVQSYARPGGNTTGVAFVAVETATKRLQYLHEAVPAITRVAVLWNPDHPDGEYPDIRAAARKLGIEVTSVEVRRPEDFDAALGAAAQARTEALMVVSSRLLRVNQARIQDWATRQRIPLVSGWGPWADSGALLSYGPDLDALTRRAASQVDRILKGARPGDVPVEQPTRFELIVNLKAARQLGIVVPPRLLDRADRVIR